MVNLDRILVTGATGFLGRHVVTALTATYGSSRVIPVSSKDFDLMDNHEVEKLFTHHSPTAIVHLAAYSGGIAANRTYPADFYFRNTILTALLFHWAAKYRVSKLIYPMGGCSYPAAATSPIGEDQLWNGYPHADSAAYSTAKMMGTVAASAYKAQYDLNSTVLIPGNLYGEYDNFHRLDSHVVPAMIRRYHEARLTLADSITQWGSGLPERDFVYAKDVAATIPFFLESENITGPVNISSGRKITIRALAESIAALTGFEGEILWDTSKPDGQMVKIFDVSALNAFGLSCNTSLDTGLESTITWFSRNYEGATDGLRL